MSENNAPVNSGIGDRGSPLPGCLIFCTILLVFGGLVVLFTVVGYTQNKKIDEFTVDQPAVIRLLKPGTDKIAVAKGKLLAIESAVSKNRADRILFTAEDLNVLIASMELAKGFQNQTYIVAIKKTGIQAEMAQPIRKSIFGKGMRYLNGTFLFSPELRANTIAFRVEDIQSSTGEIPKAFVGGYAGIDFFKLDQKNEVLTAHLPSIKKVYTEDGHLVVETRIREGK